MNVVRAIIFAWTWSYVYGRSDAIDRHGTSVHMVSSCESVVYEGKKLLLLILVDYLPCYHLCFEMGF